MYVGNDSAKVWSSIGGLSGAMAGGGLGDCIGRGASMKIASEQGMRKSEVADEIDRLSRAVDDVGKVAEVLSQRLQPVRRQIGINSAGANEASPPEPVLCDIASTIRARRKTLEHTIAVLHQSLNELEI